MLHYFIFLPLTLRKSAVMEFIISCFHRKDSNLNYKHTIGLVQDKFIVFELVVIKHHGCVILQYIWSFAMT